RRSRNTGAATDRFRRSASCLPLSVRAKTGFVDERERVHREITVGIGPHRPRRPAGTLRERRKALDRELVAVLGMDGFAGAERDGGARDSHLLAAQALQVHLDAPAFAVVERAVLEAREVEIGA